MGMSVYRDGVSQKHVPSNSEESFAMTVQNDTAVTGMQLTDGAAAKVKALLDQEGRTDLALRIAVQPGGCSGLRYQLFFDERNLEGDVFTDFSGVKVVVDRMSGPYLTGAT